jgi:23S rRNA (adenine2503-C2)-methyltransferase
MNTAQNLSMAPDLSRTNLAHLSLKELEALFIELEQPKFRAQQLHRWLWRERVTDLDQMSNLSRDLRALLKEKFRIALPQIVQSQVSMDGTIKYLLQLDDGRTVETVWIPRGDQDRVTVCVSSQVGCKMGCTFCLTAQQKVERNLRAGEIAAQILVLPNHDKVTNVVVMGMGEPFDNYDNLMGSIELMNHAEGLGIGIRHITVSTSGLVPKIERFVDESKAGLAISLNGPNDEIRTKLMPINKAYPLDTLLGSLRSIASRKKATEGSGRFNITFEYILIKGVNDQPEHARELAARVHGIPCKINLLMYNENPNIPFERPELTSVETFRKILSDRHILNFLRTSRGRDISAACGQLVSEHKRQVSESAPIQISL